MSSVRPSPNRRNTILPITTAEAQDLLDPQIAPSVKTVAPIYALAGVVTSGSESVSSTVLGVTANYNQLLNWGVRDGAFVSTRSLRDAARVAVLGSGVVEKLFGDKTYNPVGHSLRINNREFSIIGVMQDRAVGTGTDENQLTLVPLTTAQSRLDQARTHDGSYKVTVLYVQVVSKDRTDSAVQEITAYLNSAHKTPPGGDVDFVIASQANLLKTVTQILEVLTVFLGIIASISLLVGGIGIMNIMLVSVTERTREIGLRKAIGARGGDVLGQFLFESLALSLVGGLGGILLGWLITLLVGALVPDLPVAMTWFAMFRFFPALRDKGLEHLQTRHGFLQLFGLGILSFTCGAGILIVIIVSRNLPFTPPLGIFLLGGIQFTAGIVFAALGGQLRTLITGDSRPYPWYDLVIGTQIFALCFVFRPMWILVLLGLLIPALGLFTRLVFFPDRP